jgi:hypothetical protein
LPAAKIAEMRNPDLHDALRAFATDAARLLSDDLSAGAEIEFDLDEGDGHGHRLYHYRPLTARFIGERWDRLRELPTCAPAANALGAGSVAYLRMNGLRGEEAEPALQAMLERLYADATDFKFPAIRFEASYQEVEQTLYERSQTARVLVPVHGLEMDAERIDLGDGMMLERGDCADAPPEAVYGPADPGGTGKADEPAAILSLNAEVTPGEPMPVADARRRFRRLLTALRLWKPGGIALGSVAWRRAGDGVWLAFEIEPTGFDRGEPWILVKGEEAELLPFVDAIDTSTHTGSVAWALGRFEMGCGRKLEAEALSDYLLGLRALVDAGDPGGRSSLALRVAVLCAEEGDRRSVQRRVDLAQALERFVMGDPSGADYLDAIGSDSPRTLVEEVERHLRALLRDVMCGYLDSDLRSVADELLLDAVESADSKIGHYPEPEPVFVAAPQPEPESEPVTNEITALEHSDSVIGVEATEPQYDWGEEPDPEPWDDYSAPV